MTVEVRMEMSMDYTPSETISTEDDVEENIAESYGSK